MSHFAQISENNIVLQVLVIEQDVIDTGLFGPPSTWIQTSYNTYAGQHMQNGVPLRKNYASVGYTYDKDRDAFIPPKPFESWILNEETCLWKAPIDLPDNENLYTWNEETIQWNIVTHD